MPNAQIVPESGQQVLRSPEDWWVMVLGLGLRGTIDAMDTATATRVHERSVGWARDNAIQSVETNVIYAVAVKEG